MRRDHCAVCPATADGVGLQRRCGVGFTFPREIEVPRRPDPARGAPDMMRGDCVLVGVPRVGVSRAAAVAFGLPLVLMLLAAAAAQWVWGAAFGGAAAGFAGGGVLALLIARRAGLDDWVAPVLVEIRARRLAPAGDGRAAERENR